MEVRNAQRKLKIVETGPEVLRLADAVTYQQSAIVSKQLVKKEQAPLRCSPLTKGRN
jgi:hypothetical protein